MHQRQNDLKILNLFSLDNRNIQIKEEMFFNNIESVILGHLTSSIFIPDILQKGLLAQNKTGNESVGGHNSNADKDYIYLARSLDTFFSEQAVKRYGGEEILILLDIPLISLETDPFGGNLASSERKETFKAIKETSRNFRVKECISPLNILDIQTVKDLKVKKGIGYIFE